VARGAPLGEVVRQSEVGLPVLPSPHGRRISPIARPVSPPVWCLFGVCFGRALEGSIETMQTLETALKRMNMNGLR
jgi:hypothetical protein